jgi:creatinine amidohydrolase
MPSGYSEHHHGFAGTITLTPSTFADVVVAVAESVAPHGRRRLLLVNAHGDNDEPVKLATDRIQREFDLLVHTASREEVVGRLAQHFGDDWGHAGPDETSVMELRKPNLVREERKQPLTHHGIANTRQYAPFDEFTAEGGRGDPTDADPGFVVEVIGEGIEQSLETLGGRRPEQLVEAALDVLVDDVLELGVEEFLGLLEGSAEVVEAVGAVVVVEVHRPVGGALDGVHDVLEERLWRGGRVRVGLDDGADALGALLGRLLVLDGFLDPEHSWALAAPGEQVVDVLVDPPGDARADALDLEGVLRVRLQLEDAGAGMADEEVLAQSTRTVAADGPPAVRFRVALDDVLEDVLPVAHLHAVCG